MPAGKSTSIRLENFRRVFFYTKKYLTTTPSEHVHACKPPAEPQIWHNETLTNKFEPSVEEAQNASSLERYLWVGYALPRKSLAKIQYGERLKWNGEGLQAVARIDESGTLVFYVLAPMSKSTLGAKMPLLVAPDKIFFFSRFRDDSTSAGQRKEQWVAACKKVALRMQRLPGDPKGIAVGNHSVGLDSQLATPAVARAEPGQRDTSLQSFLAIDGDPFLTKTPGRPRSEMRIKPEPVEMSPNPSVATKDSEEAFWRAMCAEQGFYDYGTDAAMLARPTDTDTLRDAPDDDMDDERRSLSGQRDVSPGTSSFWRCHLMQLEQDEFCEMHGIKPEFRPAFKLEFQPEGKPELKFEFKPELKPELNDSKIKDDTKPEPADPKLEPGDTKPKPELPIHPFFDLKPDPTLDPRRPNHPFSSSSPSTTTTRSSQSSTSLEAELLQSPTDAEWATIEQKTDALKAAVGLTFEPLDILLVQRFLTMRKISFPEATVRDLTHLLHHKLYSLRPPRTSGARIRLIKGVVEDVVVLHYGRCLDRGKAGGRGGRRGDGGERYGEGGGEGDGERNGVSMP